jgi:hypothetical protein
MGRSVVHIQFVGKCGGKRTAGNLSTDGRIMLK